MSWFSRLKDGLSKTSTGISTGISDIFTKRKLDQEMLDELEELLITADIGAATASELVEAFGEGRFDKEIEPEEVKRALAEQIADKLQPVARPLLLSSSGLTRGSNDDDGGTRVEHEYDEIKKPHVVLVVGVNGNGKTTTIGKLAHYYQQQGKQVMLCAADTFRAAAVEQLQQWAERVGCPIVTGQPQADPASVAYQGLEQAIAANADILLVDTAGRLHNKADLMEELNKIVRVLKKQREDAPHTVLQVLDGTTGQNGVAQLEAFQELAGVNALAVTKLDGTAKAGIVVTLADKFNVPIVAIGVGEGKDDLQPFEPMEYAKNLVGL